MRGKRAVARIQSFMNQQEKIRRTASMALDQKQVNDTLPPPDQFKRTRLQKASRKPDFVRKTKQQCVEELKKLHQQVLARREDRYLLLHGRPNSLRRQVDVFFLYQDFLPQDGTILDWGCKHAPDSCLMRFTLGDGPRLLGYDFGRGDSFGEFYDYARLEFKEAEHTFRLPYADDSLDAVLGSGVLEHVAITTESLKELYRVLKVGGAFIITFLPNRLSYTDWLLRTTGSNAFHRRLYSRRLISELLLHHGFEPQVHGFHQFIPAQRGGKLANQMWFLNQYLERLWPFRNFCANQYVIAVKRSVI